MKSYPNYFSGLTTLLCATFLGGPSLLAQEDAAQASVVPATSVVEVDMEQLEQLVAPIALYPDALIALVLPASTASADLVLAARYLKGGGVVNQIEAQPWEDSVKGLAHYPDVVKWMDENLEWTQRLGEAYLAQPQAVMNAIQAARARAKANGILVDTPQQRVVVEDTYIKIIPAQSDIIYVPRYDPEIIYVERPVYYSPDPWLTFGIGFGVGSWLAYDLDWRHCVIWVDHHRHERWRHHRDWRHHSFHGGHRPGHRDSHWRHWTPQPGRIRPPHHDGHRWRNEIARPRPIPGSPRFDRDRWSERRNRYGNTPRPSGNRPGVQEGIRNPARNPEYRDRSRDGQRRFNRDSQATVGVPPASIAPEAVSVVPQPRVERPRITRDPSTNEAGRPDRRTFDRQERRTGTPGFTERRREGGTVSTVPSNRRPRLGSENSQPTIDSNSGQSRRGIGDGHQRTIRPAMPAVRQHTAPSHVPVQPQIVGPSTPARSVPQQRQREFRQPDRVAAPAHVARQEAPEMRQAPPVRAQIQDAPRQAHVERGGQGGGHGGGHHRGGDNGRTSRDRRAER
jgi:hypothetical protein